MRMLGVFVAAWLGVSGAVAADLQCPHVRLVVPYAAGGATDVAARLVGQGLEASLKKSVVIETRAGASGNIGTVGVIGSAPDGCTLLVNAAVIATFPHSFTKLAYDPLKDLVAIGGIGITPTVLVTANADIKDLKDLAAWSRTKPEGLNYGSAGYGLLQHLAVEEMAERFKAKFVHVPYRGGGQATTDLLTGRLDFGSFAAGSVLPLAKEGKIKALPYGPVTL
jgi:tripartite-type tricarboxylate transporter receptor subunit TctC